MGVRKVVSYECLLPSGPKIFASNHPSTLDPFFFYDFMDNPVLLIASWAFDLAVVGRVIKGCGFISVSPNYGAAAFRDSVNTLLSGRSVYICPEGKLTGESYQEAKTGAVRLAQFTGCPLVPVGIKHTGKVWEWEIGANGSRYTLKLIPFGTTFIRFGWPCWPIYRCPKEETEELMREIESLSK